MSKTLWRSGISSRPRRTQANAAVPQHVRAIQGPTDPANLYVWVTWQFVPGATAYEVARDGATIGTVTVAERWASCAFQDTSVSRGTYTYTVRCITPAGTSADSLPLSIRVRTNTPGNVYTPAGTTVTDIQNAITAAKAAALEDGSDVKVVQLAQNTTYIIDDGAGGHAVILLSGTTLKDIVLRGHKDGTTKLKAGSAGSATVDPNFPLIHIINSAPIIGATLTQDVPRGSRTIHVSSTTGFVVGRTYILDHTSGSGIGSIATEDGVTLDPGMGNDDARSYDMLVVASVDGVANTVTFTQGTSVQFRVTNLGTRPAATIRALGDATGCGIEQVQIEGYSATNANYQGGIYYQRMPEFTLAEVSFRWHNYKHLYARDAGYLNIVGCSFYEQGPAAEPNSPSIYAVQLLESPGSLVVANGFSAGEGGKRKSLLELDRCHRTVIRHNTFGVTSTYCVNPGHGFSLQETWIENNRFAPGIDAVRGSVFYGNNSWGPDGRSIVRNNLQIGGGCLVDAHENSWEIRVLDNIWQDPQITTRFPNPCLVQAYGWAGPDTDPANYGSLRWTIRRNTVTGIAPVETQLARLEIIESGTWPTDRGSSQRIVRDVVVEGNSGVPEVLTVPSGTLMEGAPFDTSTGDPRWASETF